MKKNSENFLGVSNVPIHGKKPKITFKKSHGKISKKSISAPSVEWHSALGFVAGLQWWCIC